MYHIEQGKNYTKFSKKKVIKNLKIYLFSITIMYVQLLKIEVIKVIKNKHLLSITITHVHWKSSELEREAFIDRV